MTRWLRSARRRRLAPPVLAALTVAAPVLASALAPPALAAQPRPTRPEDVRLYAISGARIVTVSGAVIDNGTVVVDDGVIGAVGAGVSVPPGAWVIDGSGKTVYPGLFDALTTLGHGSPPQQPRGGFGFGGGPGGAQPDPSTHSWGPEDRPGTSTWLTAADDIDADDDRFESWRNAGFTTVVSARHQGLVPGQAAVLNLRSFDRPREMVVATPVAMRVNLRDQSRTYTGYPGSPMGVFAYLKQLYYDAKHYDDAWAAYEADPRGKRRPEWDMALEPIRLQFDEAWPALFPATSRSDVGRAVETTREMGVKPIVYGGHGTYAAADMLADAGIPVLVDLEWPAPPTDADPEAVPSLEQLRLFDRAPTTPAALAEADVPFAFYTGGLDRPSEALAAVRRAVAQGLSEEDAIRALTLAPAEIFGVADRLGSVEEGKIANLVVAGGDLLDEDARIETVFVDGEMFDVKGADEEADDEEADEGASAGPGAGPRGGGGEARGGRGRRGGPGAGASGPDPAAPPIPMSPDKGPYRDDPTTLIRNATVLTASRGTLENTDILVRDGKIAEIGTALNAPTGATVVDATGKYVTPGIFDAHSHMAALSINEGTVNISSMVTIEDVLRPEDVGMYRALAGGVTTINVLHGSANPIGGGNSVIKLRWGADAADLRVGARKGIKFALGENTKRDRNPDRYPATRMGVQDVIRQAFLDTREYMEEWDAYEAGGRRGVAPRRDLKLEALMEILTGERWVHSHSYRADEILQLLRLAEEFGFTVRTLHHVLEGYKVADEIAVHGAGASTFSDWWAYKVEAYDAIPHNAALMTERGVLVSINSDSGEEIRHLNQEAAKAMKWGGMDEEQALRLITLNPAIQFGIEDRIGSVDEGKDADLAIWEGHPLSMYGKAVQTYVDGKLYFDIDMDRERQEAVQAEKDALVEKHLGDNR